MPGIIPKDQVVVVTSQQQVEIIKPHLPGVSASNIIIEPMPKNTAPCIGLAALHCKRLDPDAVMVVLPSDHRITDLEKFQSVLQTGIELAHTDNSLVTLGIPPNRPETGYGYIQIKQEASKLPEGVYTVETFAEKPNRPTAERFLQSGDFFWNSGIFIWKAKQILAEMEEHLPDQYAQLMLIDQAYGRDDYFEILSEHYNRIRSISIDYGIMELSHSKIFMISGGFGWSDVGSWDELFRIHSKPGVQNVTEGDAIYIDSKNNLVYSPNKLTAVIGMDNVLVVNTSDATLICPLDRAQDVKNIVEKLRKDNRKECL
jgi:mannose-1-phosphate guanylyltransferase